MEVLVDRDLDQLSRVRAARAISRLPLDGGTNLELINHEVALLFVEMCNAYQVNRKWPYWDRAFVEVFITYDGFNAVEIAGKMGLKNQVTKAGLATAQTAVTEARGLMLPLIRTVVNAPQARPDLDPKALGELEAWTKESVPSNRRVRAAGVEFPSVAATRPAVPMTLVNRPRRVCQWT